MNGMLKVPESVAIGIHAAVFLALKRERLSGHELADGMKASMAHLSKVMQRLVKEGIVDSERGPSGGFTLKADPAALTLLEVYEAIEGKFPEGGCLFSVPVCRKELCPIGSFMQRMNKEAYDYFKGTTVGEVVKTLEGRE